MPPRRRSGQSAPARLWPVCADVVGVDNLLAMAAGFAVIAASPGPATLGCAATAMAHGRHAALRFGCGLGLGLAFWGGFATLGFGAVLAASERALVALKLAGGLYLLWLAWRSARAAATERPSQPPRVAAHRWVWRGLVLNLSNPKAVFAWMATLSVGLGPEAGLQALTLAFALCAAIGFAVYLPWSLGFSHRRIMAGYRRFRRWVEAAVAGLFAMAGLGLIRGALGRMPG